MPTYNALEGGQDGLEVLITWQDSTQLPFVNLTSRTLLVEDVHEGRFSVIVRLVFEPEIVAEPLQTCQ
ncbi:hypothetical protein JMN32_21080 [Fulvivirga sp. 29W222]|uniref:Uncharacterized protein n=1 Tax=Fulvivirga marina TaxID=2494733 RepID=A0A937KDU1_9BACT|nr:hypothetical protein [Fulvivirga marina]MBL6448819.1 hypothetical protein [Fulvivirga marina]